MPGLSTSLVAFTEGDQLEHTTRRLEEQFNSVHDLLQKEIQREYDALQKISEAAREQSTAEYKTVSSRLQDTSALLKNLEAQMQAGSAARKAELAEVLGSLEKSTDFTLSRLHKERSALEELDKLKPMMPQQPR